MTLMSDARTGIPELARKVAEKEGVPPEKVARGLASGRIVIPYNPIHSPKALGIGEGLRVKVNANIGTSLDWADPAEELEKAKVALEYGTDAVMDLSIGGDLDEIRRMILEIVDVPFGTVPIYQAGVKAMKRHEAIVDMTEDDMFNAIEHHAKDGVDFVVVHAGVTKESVKRLKRQKRMVDVVSRGGSFHTAWVLHHGEENPLYSNFDYLLEIAKKYDLTLSLGDAYRSGAIADANDRVKMQELLIVGELMELCREAGVQGMVEGPGHVPLNMIESNVQIMKSVTKGAPYYVLGPLVTDIAPGYDHIVGAIGGALAGYVGVDFLCYVTPSEHLCLPNVEDVKQGVITSRIAAHVANLARGFEIAWEQDNAISKARKNLDWNEMFKHAVDPELARKRRSERGPSSDEVCSMCGDYCAIKIVKEYLEK